LIVFELFANREKKTRTSQDCILNGFSEGKNYNSMKHCKSYNNQI